MEQKKIHMLREYNKRKIHCGSTEWLINQENNRLCLQLFSSFSKENIIYHVTY